VKRVSFFCMMVAFVGVTVAGTFAQRPVSDGSRWDHRWTAVPQYIIDDLRNATWNTGMRYGLGTSVNCGTVRAETMRVLDSVPMWESVANDNAVGEFFGGGVWISGSDDVPGKTFGPHILIDRNQSAAFKRGTIIHDPMHSAQFNSSLPINEDKANLAIDCLTIANDSDGESSGSAAGGGGGDGPRIISKRPHVSIPRVWVIRYIPGGGNGPAVSIGELEVICDYDTDDDVWDDCPDTYKKNSEETES